MPQPLDKDLATKSKNSLTIRLTESAVFLRSESSLHNDARSEGKPSILRGLLILNLEKPTKISGIEIELVGKTEASWPEGIGPRRIEVSEEHRFFRASTTFFEASSAHSRRTASIGPGVAARDHDLHHDDWEEQHHTADSNQASNEDSTSRRSHQLRYASVDASHYHSNYVSHHEEYFSHVPPYSVLPPTPSSSNAPSILSSSHSLSQDPGPAHNLEEFRAALNRGHHALISPARTTLTSSSQTYSPSRRDFSVSRQPSMDGVPEDSHMSMPGQVGYSSNVNRRSHTSRQISPHPPSDQDRGRRSRFTLAKVSQALMGVVRSTSPMLTRSRERSRDDYGSIVRGRTIDKRRSSGVASPLSPQATETGGMAMKSRGSKERHLFDKFGEMLHLDEPKEHKGVVRDWKEFKKGVYTYPISFQIPADSPPTMLCDFGAVSWRLCAHVHRPGAFKHKYTAERPVIVVSCPTEDDTEETESIIVERHWAHQVQYLIAISGRSFHIGGTLPITFTLLPLSKAKVYRVAVFLEERTEYYTNMHKLARADPPSRFELLFIRHDGKNAPHILPLESDDPEAFLKSPMFTALSSQLESNAEVSELASSFMGPGPWTFHLNLKLPESCSMIKPTNENKRANMVVSHLLRIMLRMERGDDRVLDQDGRRKLFDVIVQTPVHILSCRSNPEWALLPRYSESSHQVENVIQSCPCRTPQDLHHARAGSHRPPSIYRPTLERTISRDSTDSNVSAADDQAVDPVSMASLRHPHFDDLVVANALFESLVSGQQSEMGERPPAYEAASAHLPILPTTPVSAS